MVNLAVGGGGAHGSRPDERFSWLYLIWLLLRIGFRMSFPKAWEASGTTPVGPQERDQVIKARTYYIARIVYEDYECTTQQGQSPGPERTT